MAVALMATASGSMADAEHLMDEQSIKEVYLQLRHEKQRTFPCPIRCCSTAVFIIYYFIHLFISGFSGMELRERELEAMFQDNCERQSLQTDRIARLERELREQERVRALRDEEALAGSLPL